MKSAMEPGLSGRKFFRRSAGSAALRVAVMSIAGILAGIAGATAQATTVPFTEALAFSVNPNATGINNGLNDNSSCCDYPNIVNSVPPTAATVTYSQSGTWGSVNSFASANLATGQLRMSASATMGDGSASPYIQSNAIFGDGFRTATPNGQPYTWTSASNARFTLNLSGLMTASDPLDAYFNADVFVILSILQKDTLDPTQPLVNGPTAQQYFFWNIGNPSSTIYYTDQNGNSQALTPTAQYSTIPSTITANFNPGGDFDWVLLLGASGQLMNPGDYFNFDLSHTLDFSYAGPEDSVTTSVSGLFSTYDATLPDNQVPEPGTLALLGLGVMGCVYVRRRSARRAMA